MKAEVAVDEPAAMKCRDLVMQRFEELPDADAGGDRHLLDEAKVRLGRLEGEWRELVERLSRNEAAPERRLGASDRGRKPQDLGGTSMLAKLTLGILVEAGGIVGLAKVERVVVCERVTLERFLPRDDELPLDQRLLVRDLLRHAPHDEVAIGRMVDQPEESLRNLDRVLGRHADPHPGVHHASRVVTASPRCLSRIVITAPPMIQPSSGQHRARSTSITSNGATRTSFGAMSVSTRSHAFGTMLRGEASPDGMERWSR